MGVRENTKYVYDNIRSIHKVKGGQEAQKLENLLKQVHYSQLIGFDYKFASKWDNKSCLKTIHYVRSYDCGQHECKQWEVHDPFENGIAQLKK